MMMEETGRGRALDDETVGGRLDYGKATKALDISERTAKRHWTFAPAWRFREFSAE